MDIRRKRVQRKKVDAKFELPCGLGGKEAKEAANEAEMKKQPKQAAEGTQSNSDDSNDEPEGIRSDADRDGYSGDDDYESTGASGDEAQPDAPVPPPPPPPAPVAPETPAAPPAEVDRSRVGLLSYVRANTGKSSCYSCNAKIAKDAWRIEYSGGNK